jgi:hypothetical protein
LVRRPQNIIFAFGTAQISQRVPEKKTTSGLWAAILKYGVRRRATLSVKLPLGAPPPKHNFSIWNGAHISTGAREKNYFRFVSRHLEIWRPPSRDTVGQTSVWFAAHKTSS